LIVKCPPLQRDGEGRSLVLARPFWNVQPEIGDEVFVWTSETQGGTGLAARGVLEAAGDGDPLPVLLKLDPASPARPLGKADLLELSAIAEGDPRSSLSKKLYGNSHNKIAALDPGEAALLASRFRRPQTVLELHQPPGPRIGGWGARDVFLPNGTEIRMTYGGKSTEGRIEEGFFLVKGQRHRSPSGAARAAARTKDGSRPNLNGWTYWEARLPGSDKWVLLDDLYNEAQRAAGRS